MATPMRAAKPATPAAVIACAVLLAACGPGERVTPARSSDPAPPPIRIDRGTAETADEATLRMAQASPPVARTADPIANKAQDVAIDTDIRAAFARDDALDRAAIEIDTVDGRVVLRGQAPDAPTRERATALALGVAGVRSVDNQITVRPTALPSPGVGTMR